MDTENRWGLEVGGRNGWKESIDKKKKYKNKEIMMAPKEYGNGSQRENIFFQQMLLGKRLYRQGKLWIRSAKDNFASRGFLQNRWMKQIMTILWNLDYKGTVMLFCSLQCW